MCLVSGVFQHLLTGAVILRSIKQLNGLNVDGTKMNCHRIADDTIFNTESEKGQKNIPDRVTSFKVIEWT